LALVEKVTQVDDLYLFEIFRNPVLCGEFIQNYDHAEWEEPFEFTYYQKEILCDFNSHVSVCTARATGKTVSFVNLLLWVLLFNLYPGDYIVYSVPNKVHLEPVFTGLIRALRGNSLLKQFIAPSKGINSSTHTITLLNQAVLLCRIAGQTGTGANVIGLHTPFTLVDEGGYYPWGTWVEQQPTMNTFTEGFRLGVAGVPTGLMSAYDNPRFTEEDEERAIEQYGSKENDDFIHLVLGEHGAPIFSVFDRRLFEIESYPVNKLTLDGIKLKGDMKKKVLIGIDLGYTDPTAILILYEGRNGILRFHARIQLNKVSYNVQDRIIDWLDTKYRPSIIGIDVGSSGLAVSQRLLESVDYKHKKYPDRLIPINFSSMVVIGTDADGEELKQKTKPYSVTVLQNYTNNHRLVYSSTDIEMVAELERMTYTKTPSGEIVYKTLTPKGGQRGDDHFTAALLCGSMAYYLANESLALQNKPVKLMRTRWL
jgi:hypothetical protein